MLIKNATGDTTLLEVRAEGVLQLTPQAARCLLDALSDCALRDLLVARVPGGEWYKLNPSEPQLTKLHAYEKVSEDEHIQYSRKMA